ncbi:VOC family protein [Spirosoma fluviale]|uniref:Catechol 2,3-dioxygenase n=1 Tax=Spirosoma fluviale TaxID=1597977 RepID=A0A286GUF2_9BACT|nr:VOC family protein [Spirosoma fluviale]SOD99197.1 Catechol 2,3-dioxygenase [Spirosoma fluviale]
MNSTSIRGIDHIGITVPDIEAATQFLIAAFGAEVIYESLSRVDPPIEGSKPEKMLLLSKGTQTVAVRMIKLQHGPGIELIEMHAPQQLKPVRPSDFGLQHFALYLDDMSAAVARFTAAGGVIFDHPAPNLFPLETGSGNIFCYGRTPWGTVIELITLPTPPPYEQKTTLRRWRP